MHRERVVFIDTNRDNTMALIDTTTAKDILLDGWINMIQITELNKF